MEGLWISTKSRFKRRIMERSNRCYLGDGVYADIQEYADSEFNELVLTTEVGLPEPTNRIVLEPSVISALVTYLERLKRK